jgi:hypothetical protein
MACTRCQDSLTSLATAAKGICWARASTSTSAIEQQREAGKLAEPVGPDLDDPPVGQLDPRGL